MEVLPLVPVRVVRAVDLSALVEWRDDETRLRRGYVPVSEIEEDQVAAAVLELAIPYGCDWERALDLSGVTPTAVAEWLREAGIWTIADLKERDRALIRIGTNMIGKAVWKAAQKLEEPT